MSAQSMELEVLRREFIDGQLSQDLNSVRLDMLLAQQMEIGFILDGLGYMELAYQVLTMEQAGMTNGDTR
jgi:hypothetical protein